MGCPFSKIASDRWTLHFNAGMSVFPNAHDNRRLTNYDVGASAIYLVSRDFNFMLEALAGLNEDIAEGGSHSRMIERSTTANISPGVRYGSALFADLGITPGNGFAMKSSSCASFVAAC